MTADRVVWRRYPLPPRTTTGPLPARAHVHTEPIPDTPTEELRIVDHRHAWVPAALAVGVAGVVVVFAVLTLALATIIGAAQ